MIHAKHAVPGAIRGVVKDSVGRKWTGNFGFSIWKVQARSLRELRYGDFGLQLLHGWFDYLGFFMAQRAGFTGVRVQTSDGDARLFDSAAPEEIFQQQTDADNLFRF